MANTTDTGTEQEVLHTPAEWCSLLDRKILDPDGWRGPDGKDWLEPIGRTEFEHRFARSTVFTPPEFP